MDKREKIINKEFERKPHGALVIRHVHESAKLKKLYY